VKERRSERDIKLIFYNHFYRRKEAQEELQKAKLIISLLSSLSVLTEGVAGDVVSHRGALPGSPNRVLGHRLPVHQNGNPNHSNNEVVYNSWRIDSLFLFQNCKVFSLSTACKGNVELTIGSFTV